MFTVDTFNSTYVVADGRITRYGSSELFDAGTLFKAGSEPTVGEPWAFRVLIDGYYLPVLTSPVTQVWR